MKGLRWIGRVGKVIATPVTKPVGFAVRTTKEKVHMTVVSRVSRYLAVAVCGALVGAGYVTEAESQELIGAIVTVALIAARVWYAEKEAK